MSTFTTTITQSGQISLPKAIREDLGVKPGDRVIFSIAEDKSSVIIKRRLSDEEFLAKLDSMKTPKAKEMEKKYAGKTVAELRQTPEYKKYYKEKYGL